MILEDVDKYIVRGKWHARLPVPPLSIFAVSPGAVSSLVHSSFENRDRAIQQRERKWRKGACRRTRRTTVSVYVTRLTKNLFCKCTLSRLVVVVGGGRLGIRIKEKQDSTRLAKENLTIRMTIEMTIRISFQSLEIKAIKQLWNYRWEENLCEATIIFSLFSIDLRVDLYIFYFFFFRIKKILSEKFYSIDEPEEVEAIMVVISESIII